MQVGCSPEDFLTLVYEFDTLQGYQEFMVREVRE
jgi:hypothetical protein